MVICLERGADLHKDQLMPLPLASVKPRLLLLFWYRLTWVVLEKGPLNGCVCYEDLTILGHFNLDAVYMYEEDKNQPDSPV